jgi:HD domain
MTWLEWRHDHPLHARRVSCPGNADRQPPLMKAALTTDPVSVSFDPAASQRASARSPSRAIRSVRMPPKQPIPEASQSFPKALAALAYAARLHVGQRRQADGAPFIWHPLEVAGLLHHAGAPDHVIAAGVLHDTIEKTDATAADLTTRFGIPITALVLAVSEDQRISGYAERKAALREQVAKAGHEALMIFAADKISKARELRLQSPRTRQQPARFTRSRNRRLAHYRHCLRLLEEHLTDSPLVAQLRAELEKPAGIANGPPLPPGGLCH